MAVLVVPARPIGRAAVVATGDVQVGMRADPGIDDRDVGIDPLVDPVDLGQRRGRRADPRDAGRHRLRLDLDDLVGYDGGDVRVGEQRGPLRLVELGREATERVPEGAVGDRPLAFAVGARDGRRVRVALQHHEVVARSDRSALAIDRRRASTSRESWAWQSAGPPQTALGTPPCSRLASVRPTRRVRQTAPRSGWDRSASAQAGPAAPGSRPGRSRPGRRPVMGRRPRPQKRRKARSGRQGQGHRFGAIRSPDSMRPRWKPLAQGCDRARLVPIFPHMPSRA